MGPLDFHDLGSLVVLKNVPFGVALLFPCLVRGCEFGREVRKEDHSQPIRSGSHVIDITPMLTLFSWLRQCLPGFSNI